MVMVKMNELIVQLSIVVFTVQRVCRSVMLTN